MPQSRPYDATPEEIGTLLVLAREHRGLSRLAASRLLETDQSNLRKAELNSERHLVYAVDMLSRYAQLDSEETAQNEAKIAVLVPTTLNSLVDEAREPTRVVLREYAIRMLSGIEGVVIDSTDPSMLKVHYNSHSFVINIDQRSLMGRLESGKIVRTYVPDIPAKMQPLPGEQSDEQLVDVIIANICSISNANAMRPSDP